MGVKSLMNPKAGERRTSLDAGRKNLIVQRQGSDSSVRKLPLLLRRLKNSQRNITMTQIQTVRRNRIALHASKQAMHYAEVEALAPVYTIRIQKPNENPTILDVNK